MRTALAGLTRPPLFFCHATLTRRFILRSLTMRKALSAQRRSRLSFSLSPLESRNIVKILFSHVIIIPFQIQMCSMAE